MRGKGIEPRFNEAIDGLLGPDFPPEIALAVSGGGDSMGMLVLACGWARTRGVRLSVVTVDHGLREGSAAEAEMVAHECSRFGHRHEVLHWHWDGSGNLQDAARRGRLELINRWRGEIEHVLMAHTRDDLAETFLLRLARGSGVEGLAAMQAAYRTPGGFQILRPCLGITRSELRHYLNAGKIRWIEDPSNDDPRFDRVRVRLAQDVLNDLGLDAARLAGTAQRMARAREALRARAVSVADAIAGRALTGCVTFTRAGLAATERDTQLRLLAAAIMWVSASPYRPRSDALEDLTDRLLGGGAGTLSGAKAETTADEVILFREYAALSETSGPLWDGRWRVTGPDTPGTEIRPLGDALPHCPDWRETGQPRAALMASPAIWQGEMLLAAPVAGFNPDWQAQIDADFTTFLLSH